MRGRWTPAALLLAVAVLTLLLGFWQRDRAHRREALAAYLTQGAAASAVTLGAAPLALALAAIEYRRVHARGTFMPELTVYLDNRPNGERPGFYVVTPLHLDGGGYVLVKRGWLPLDTADRNAIAPYPTPPGPVDIDGIARADASRAFEIGHASAAHRRIRQNLDVAAYARETGLPLQPFVIEQRNDTRDGLLRDWPAPALGAERNYGYMLQWWAMAALAGGFGLYAGWRAWRNPGAPR